ncbi:MAG: carboxylate--amine ligase [Phycisphaerae bacterium]|nr:carboxylate--amine ligase [Phycisphaerae bacterium]
MNVLFLSPNFPPNFRHFCAALRDEGATVLGVGDSQEPELGDEVRALLADYVCVPDMYNRYDDLRRAVESLIRRHGKIDRLDSLNEHWLEHEARLREDFDVFGQRLSDLARNRRKLGMKDGFREAGVPVAPAEMVTSLDGARMFARRHGFPVILKPDVGVGAVGVQRVNDMAQLEAAIGAQPAPGTVIEAFVRGTILTFDGLIDRAGEILHCTSHVYSSGVMEIASGRLTMHYYSLRDLPPVLESHGRRIVKAFGVRERFVHIEFFLTGDGGAVPTDPFDPSAKYRALEINVRPPGGWSIDMMNYAADINLYRIWARLLVHNDASLKYQRKFHVAHVGRRHEIPYRTSSDEIRRNPGVAILHAPVAPALWRPLMGDEVFLLGDPDLDRLKQAIARAEEIR